MTTSENVVQVLHRMNRQKSDLLGQLRRGPLSVEAARKRLQLATDQAQTLRDQLTKLRMSVDSKQLQMRECEQKIHKWKGMMNASKENREYQALKEQIAADSKANEVLSDEIFEILESIDESNVRLGEAEQRIAEFRQEMEKLEAQVGSRKVVLESELARVEAELGKAEQYLPSEFKRDYERLVIAKGEDAMAELDGNSCGGCCKSLTPMQMDRLLMGQSIVCPNCGRLVYKSSE